MVLVFLENPWEKWTHVHPPSAIGGIKFLSHSIDKPVISVQT
jgi:hypothetical protein